MIQNPILKGFCPDPSIVRAGEDYYIANSTFEWWPGVKLFHSRDLKNWEQIASPLRRESQLNMLGDPTSGGVWAPCLSYDGKRFFLTYTDVKTKKGRFYNTHNYVVWTEDIEGDWSDPVYLNSVGFDPSLFHDVDGRKYLINMVNGFKGILVQELNPDTMTLIGESKKVYNGSGIGCLEGPHMYHIGEWYYLLAAEGGTGYDHCVTLARSKSIWGPFETAPNNPILTSDRADGDALQKCGHGDITDTPDGEWYLVHLCSRPLKGSRWCTLGRETAIQKLKLKDDGWFCLEEGGCFASMLVKSPKGYEEPQMSLREEIEFEDSFDERAVPVRYVSPRVNYESFVNLEARKGFLRLRGQESMNSLHHVSLLAVRQQSVLCTAETRMEFTPEYSEQLAGLAYMYDAMNFYLLGKTLNEDGKTILTLLRSDCGVVEEAAEPVRVPAQVGLGLKATVFDDGKLVQFFYNVGEGGWMRIGEAQTTEILTDEHCRGFTGAHFGMYIHDMMRQTATADFDSFSVRCP